MTFVSPGNLENCLYERFSMVYCYDLCALQWSNFIWAIHQNVGYIETHAESRHIFLDAVSVQWECLPAQFWRVLFFRSSFARIQKKKENGTQKWKWREQRKKAWRKHYSHGFGAGILITAMWDLAVCTVSEVGSDCGYVGSCCSCGFWGGILNVSELNI